MRKGMTGMRRGAVRPIRGRPVSRQRPSRRQSGDISAAAVRLAGWQRTAAVAAGAAAAALAAGFYYQSLWAGMLFAPFGLYAPRIVEQELENRRRARLREQFKEALHCLVTSLSAGRSVDNAIMAVPEELKILYPDPKAVIRREFEQIRIRLQNGERLEEVLRRFSARSGLEEAERFAEVIAVAKRSGGDLTAIVRNAAQLIGEKMEVEREIAVLTAGKRFESRLMMGAPFAFVMVLAAAAPDYMAPLYGSIAGYVILTIGLAALAGCAWLIRKLMTIEV